MCTAFPRIAPVMKLNIKRPRLCSTSLTTQHCYGPQVYDSRLSAQRTSSHTREKLQELLHCALMHHTSVKPLWTQAAAKAAPATALRTARRGAGEPQTAMRTTRKRGAEALAPPPRFDEVPEVSLKSRSVTATNVYLLSQGPVHKADWRYCGLCALHLLPR